MIAIAADVPAVVPAAIVAPLRVPGSESRFRGVYRKDGGWVARVRVPILYPGRAPLENIGRTMPFASHAAYLLAKWYESQYGENWPDVVRYKSRKRNWSQPWRIWYSPSRNGWLLCVWERGRRLEVTRHGGLIVFPTRDDAVEFLPVWVEKRYGDDAKRVLYRI